MVFALCIPAEAQQPGKVYQLGYLSAFDPARESARAEVIRLALRERGYMEAQNIAIEYLHAEGKQDRFPKLAAELVRLNVERFFPLLEEEKQILLKLYPPTWNDLQRKQK